jgi:hypothetical protein
MNKRIAVTLVGGLLLGLSTATFAGVTFTQVTTVDGKRTAVNKVWSEGGNAKTEMVEAPDNPFMPVGSYLLFTAAGDLYVVNPAARTFARFDAGMFEGMAAMAGQMEITGVKSEKTLDEPGGEISGYATRHYQFKSSWSFGMQGIPMKTEMNVVEDIWATTAIELPQMAAGPAAAAMPSQVAELAEAQGLRQIEGVPLKHVSVQGTKMNMGAGGGLGGLGAGLGARMASRMAGGAGGETTTTMEVIDIAEADVPASTFALPDGYRETQLFQTGPAVPDLNNVQEAPAVPNLNDLN